MMNTTRFTLADIESRFGSEDSTFVHEQITALYEEIDDPCCDNQRFAPDDDGDLMRAYNLLSGEGCCGSVDRRVGPSPSGHYYMIGFNYGH